MWKQRSVCHCIRKKCIVPGLGDFGDRYFGTELK
ncbi:MAG: uracil phosphoribosyltransferase [Proteobacteria bacterium]|nr:uracil phosphoribosyltransferase [Pseudomonadota bacterium]MBU4010539.1 uracil phosphoribosyltransferase [Pseudomonadota bacterium]